MDQTFQNTLMMGLATNRCLQQNAAMMAMTAIIREEVQHLSLENVNLFINLYCIKLDESLLRGVDHASLFPKLPIEQRSKEKIQAIEITSRQIDCFGECKGKVDDIGKSLRNVLLVEFSKCSSTLAGQF